MKWLTLLCFAPALGWTAISFLAYRDLAFAFQSSLIGWVACGLLWGGLRLTLPRLGWGARRGTGKAKTPKASRVAAMAATVAAVSVAVLILSVFVIQWLENRSRSGDEPLATVRRSETAPTSTKTKPSTPPAPTAVAAQNGEAFWSVQVSAFKAEQNAVDLAAGLKDRGWEAYVIRAKGDGGQVYRIHVGRFRTREAAERLLRKLKDKEGLGNAFVARM